ncbi:MAG: sulfotransferase domain-containing protein [Acidimicrobiales bacterium]
MTADLVHYESLDEDSARWIGFEFRDGDVVISTRSKTGSTWVQMICALLIFQSPDLPARLSEISPWLDWLIVPRSEVYARLAAQDHRRFIKTHTPLDGVPIDSKATYIVTGRHPLDMAVSLYHQGANIDRDRLRQLTGGPEPTAPTRQRPEVTEWLVSWIDKDSDPRESPDSLPGVMWHLSDAWARRHEPNILLLHYADLLRDLEAEMRRMAEHLKILVPEDRWPSLVAAATFDGMRLRSEVTVPDPSGIFIDRAAFFRGGRSGDGSALLNNEQIDRYHRTASKLAPPDMLEWLHDGTAC